MNAVALRVTNVLSQTSVEGLAEIETLNGARGRTDIMMGLEVAVFPKAHIALEFTTQVTVSPSSGAYVKVGLFGPITIPFTFHQKVGFEPPFTG